MRVANIHAPTTVVPIATPAAVDAICPNSPGCFGCCGAGCATLEAGLAAGTLDTGLGGEEDRLLPRGMCSLRKNSVENLMQRLRDVNSLWHRGINYDACNQLICKLKERSCCFCCLSLFRPTLEPCKFAVTLSNLNQNWQKNTATLGNVAHHSS